MTSALGVDGCSAGWLAARNDSSGTIELAVFPRIEDALEAADSADVILIDIPIGLISRGGEGRACDRIARRLLGSPRASSVFTPPCRPALACSSYVQASRLNERLTGKRLTKQAWGISRKIKEVDELLRRRTDLRDRVYEAHPELLFRALNGGRPMSHGKATAAGLAERLSTLSRFLPSANEVFEDAAARWPRSKVSRDDITDAIVALVNASFGTARLQTIPDPPDRDEFGLPMRMVFRRDDGGL
jgi:predicted RNase H-like nuclease